MSYSCFSPMRLFLTIVVVLGLASCSKDSFEKLADRTEKTISEITATIESIDSRESAEAARPKLEKLFTELREIGEDANALDEIPAETRAKIEPRLNEAKEKLWVALMGAKAHAQEVITGALASVGGDELPTNLARGTQSDESSVGLAPAASGQMAALDRAIAGARGADGSIDPGALGLPDPSGDIATASPESVRRSVDEAIARAAATAGSSGTIEALLGDAANSAKSEVERLTALSALETQALASRAKELVPALSSLLDDKSAKLRSSAAALVSRLGGEASALTPKIAGLLEDSETAQAAIQAFTTLGAHAKAAVPALIETLRTTSSDDVRGHIVQALAGIGTAAKDAIPVLESITAAGGTLARSARDALAKIRGE